MRKNHSRAGFTLVETLVVIAIIVVGAALFLPSLPSPRYGIRIQNKTTNDFFRVKVSWDGHEVNFFGVAAPSTRSEGDYGAPSSDRAICPNMPMPKKDVLIQTVSGSRTNTTRIVLSPEVLQAVRDSYANFHFILNTDGTITSTFSGP